MPVRNSKKKTLKKRGGAANNKPYVCDKLARFCLDDAINICKKQKKRFGRATVTICPAKVNEILEKAQKKFAENIKEITGENSELRNAILNLENINEDLKEELINLNQNNVHPSTNADEGYVSEGGSRKKKRTLKKKRKQSKKTKSRKARK
jgi:hypothetical protein